MSPTEPNEESNGEPIESLVAEFVERREAGEAIDACTFVATHPESGPALATALAALEDVEGLFPAEAVPVPGRIGPYRVLRELGRGGMGLVLRVEHVDRPGELLALKQLHFGAVTSARGLERLRREGAILAQLDHPGIVRVVELVAEGGVPFLVMEEVEGTSLADHVARARERVRAGCALEEALELPGEGDALAQVLRVGLQVARAVEHAHAAGLLHRDVKPSNVLVRPDGAAVLIDFGLAVHEDSATLTGTGDLIGTPHYMAPEQARGERVGPGADVYGVGALLYELFALAPPHPGSDALAVLRHVQTRPIAGLSVRRPDLPGPVVQVTERALHWNAGRRHLEARELVADLEALLAGTTPATSRPSPLARAENLIHFHPRAVASAGILGAFAILVVLFFQFGGGSATIPRNVDEVRREATIAWLAEDEETLVAALESLATYGSSDALAFFRIERGEDGDPPATGVAADLLTGLARMEDDPRAALAAFSRASQTAPDWSLPAALAGRAARRAKDPTRAEREYALAARQAPGSLVISNELARALYDLDRLEEARAEVDRWHATDPADLRYWDVRSRIAMKQGDTETVIEACERIITEDPTPSRSVFNRYGVAFDVLGEHGRAQDLYRRTLERHPESTMLMFNLAYSYDMECRMTEAREVYRGVLEHEPDDLKAKMSLVNIAAGGNPLCEECLATLEVDPTLFDPAEVSRLLLEVVAHDRCETEWLTKDIDRAFERVGPREDVLAALRATIAEAEIDERVLRVERLLRKYE